MKRLAALALVAGCAVLSPASAKSSPGAERAVRAVIDGILAADNARDLEAVLGFYADDAILMPPNEGSVHGKEAIARRYEELFRTHTPALRGKIDEVRVAEGWAFAAGRTGGTMNPLDGGKPRDVEDAWVMLLERNGQGPWRIARLMWHPVRPPGAPRGDP